MREEEKIRSLLQVNEDFSTTSNAEIGLFKQLLDSHVIGGPALSKS